MCPLMSPTHKNSDLGDLALGPDDSDHTVGSHQMASIDSVTTQY